MSTVIVGLLSAFAGAVVTFSIVCLIGYRITQNRRSKALSVSGSIDASLLTGQVVIQPPEGYSPKATYKEGTWVIEFWSITEADAVWFDK